MKKCISVFKNFIVSHKSILLMILPWIMLELCVMVLASDIDYFRGEMVVPWILFQVSFIGLFVAVCANVHRVAGRILYGVLYIFFTAMYVTHGVYYKLMDFFFSFKLLELAGEGSDYMLDAIINTNPLVYISALVCLIFAVIAIIKMPAKKDWNIKGLFITVVVFVVLHLITPLFLGSANSTMEWDTWRNPRNVYTNFNDANKNIKICGLYEYTIRDIYINLIKPEEPENPEELKYLENLYDNADMVEANDYTGMFEGKNIIFLQMEGIDSWLFNKEVMPHTYGLLENAINFTEHYSYYNGGGSTFNSEFAVNTGFVTPISYNRNAYTFNSNDFKHSMANIFKEKGYSVNAFHMNSSEYYSRGINYKAWGYDNYFSLKDLGKYNDLSYEMDRELILNETFNKELFNSEKPFVHYIITYTPHTPFTTDKGIGKFMVDNFYNEYKGKSLSEEESAKLFAKETDHMVGLLMEELKENDLFEDTVIVAFADHYLYTLTDKTILDKYKETSNNLINHTPFFIWSHDLEKSVSDKVNSQLDILPTVLNLFGIDYNVKNYIGRDIMSENYDGYVFFSDYSWYNGKSYVQDGEAVSGTEDKKHIEEMNSLINELIKQNDLTLKYDFFRRMEK